MTKKPRKAHDRRKMDKDRKSDRKAALLSSLGALAVGAGLALLVGALFGGLSLEVSIGMALLGVVLFVAGLIPPIFDEIPDIVERRQ